MDSMVTLTIDGIELAVKPGTTILEAAQQTGIHIPTLCYDKRLAPYGGSFICMVEVTTGAHTAIAPACVTAVAEGMEVATNTPKLIDGRRMQLMLLLRTHPLLCPTCDAAGDCRLQQLVHEYGIPELPFARDTRDNGTTHDSLFIRRNTDVCIMCGLCVRICEEIQGENQLSLVNRGMASEVSTAFGLPLDCDFCGQCAQICPVGAISSKWLVGRGRQFELKQTDTICAFCSMGCTLTLRAKGEKVVYVTSPVEGPNEGSLCVKGRYGWPYVYSEQRLRKPLIRRDEALVEVEWDEALRFAAEGFDRIKRTSGSSSLAALGSERLTNEEAYLFNRFVRTVMGTPHLDHAGGYAYRPLVDGLGPTLGYSAGTNSIREIRNSRVILLLGADLSETHPVAKNEVIIATGPTREGEVVIVDCVRTRLCDRRGIELLTPPGMEHLIPFAMLREIIKLRLYDKKTVDLIDAGFDDLLASLHDYSTNRVAKLTGVDADKIRQAATIYAQAPTATIILAAGMHRAGNNVALAQAAADLALLTGRIGKESCGIHLFGEKANSQGAMDMGLGPDLLPGFQAISDERARAGFETAWESPLPGEIGMDARKILRKAESNEIRGLYIVGENPVETYPERQQVVRALQSLEFLVVQDMFLTATAEMAHAVLPAVSFMEKTGTYTSSERRVQRLRPVLGSAGPKRDMEIFHALADLMGKPWRSYGGPEQVMEEIAELVDSYRGISYHRLGAHGVSWPCSDSQHPGKEFLYTEGFPDEKPKFVPAPPIEEPPSPDGLPFSLIPVIVKFHSGSLSQYSASLMEVSTEGYAEMNGKDMGILDLSEGDRVRITSATRAAVEVKVKQSRRSLEGSVLIPYHFSSLKLNNLTRWGQPVVKVRVEKIREFRAETH